MASSPGHIPISAMQSEPVEAHGFGNECKTGLMQHNVAFASERHQQHWLLFIFRPPRKSLAPHPLLPRKTKQTTGEDLVFWGARLIRFHIYDPGTKAKVFFKKYKKPYLVFRDSTCTEAQRT